MVLCVHDLGRQTGAEELASASRKGGCLTRRPDARRAAIDQRRRKRTMAPSYNPLRGLGLLKYSSIIATGPGLFFFTFWGFFSFFL